MPVSRDTEPRIESDIAPARRSPLRERARDPTLTRCTLAFARNNLCAALLALDDCAGARPVAQAAWPQVVAFELQHSAAACLALLAALEGRPRAAARLLGYAQAIYAARAEAIEANERTSMERARALAAAVLGAAEFAAAHAAGARVGDAEAAAIAWGSEDR